MLRELYKQIKRIEEYFNEEEDIEMKECYLNMLFHACNTYHTLGGKRDTRQIINRCYEHFN